MSARPAPNAVMASVMLTLMLLGPPAAASSPFGERVQVVDAFADLRIKVVDHLPDERWRVRTGCAGQADLRVERVDAFEDIRVKIVDALADREVCVLRQSPPITSAPSSR